MNIRKECASGDSGSNIKSGLFHALGTVAAVFIGHLIGRGIGSEWVGWGFVGGLMGLSAALFMIPKQRRTWIRTVLSVALPAALVPAVIYLLGGLN